MASNKLFKKIAIGLTLFVVVQTLISGVVPALATQKAYAQAGPIEGTTSTTQSFTNPTNYTKCVFNYAPGTDGASITGCVVQFIYWAVFEPSQQIASLAGRFLDFFINFSISSATYKGLTFIDAGWGVVRDITNIAFIFALLLAAFSFVLNMNLRVDPKKLILNVIIFGLLINFSLFFTKVIIDAGNVMATVFYNHVGAKDAEGNYIMQEQGERNIALAIVNNSDPQKIWDAKNAPLKDLTFVIATLIGAIAINVGFIILFFSVGYLFLGRVVGLTIQMIFSPLAFASKVFPFSMPRFGFDAWLKDTFQIAFMAPIFMFFLYLVLQIQNIQTQYTNLSGDAIITLINVLLPYALTFAFLMFAKKVTKSMAGEAAGMIAGYLTKATGMVGGLVLTGASAGLTAGLGAAGAGLAAQTAGKTGALARFGNTVGKKAATSNFDFRSSYLGKRLQTGIKQSGGALNLGTPTKKTGGYQGIQDRYIKKQEDKAKEFSTILANEAVAKNKANAEARLRNAQNMKDSEFDSANKTVGDLRDKRKELEEELKFAKQRAKSNKDEDQTEVLAVKAKLNDLKKDQDNADIAVRSTNKYKENNLAQVELKAAEKKYKDEAESRKKDYTEKIMMNGWNQAINPLATTISKQQAISNIRGKAEPSDEFKKKPEESAAAKAHKDEVAGLEGLIKKEKEKNNKQGADQYQRDLDLLKEKRAYQEREEDILRQEGLVLKLKDDIEKAEAASKWGDVTKFTSQYNKLTVQLNNNKLDKINNEQTQRQTIINSNTTSSAEKAQVKIDYATQQKQVEFLQEQNKNLETRIKAEEKK